MLPTQLPGPEITTPEPNKSLSRYLLISTAENFDPSNHAVPQDVNGWAQVKTSGGWYTPTL